MFALSAPPAPEPPRVYTGYVLQVRYSYTSEGRFQPFVDDDDVFDLRFRDWYPNGFTTRQTSIQEMSDLHEQAGWDHRVLPGVVERHANGVDLFFTVH